MTEIQKWQPPAFEEGTSLIPTRESVTALADPRHLVGREDVDIDDLIVPALDLLQGQSEAVTSGVPGAQPGKFQHSNSGQIFEPPLQVLIVHYHRSNAFFPKPDKYPEAKGKEVCLSRDGVKGTVYGLCEDCRICLDWFEDPNDRRPPMGARNHVFTVWTSDGPAVLRFSRTSFKAARKFLSDWNFSSKNLWAHPVVITTHQEQKQLEGGKKSTYYRMDLRWDRTSTVPEDWQAAARTLYDRISGAHEKGKFGDELEGTASIGEFD